jgi:hypothetical protein
MRDPQSPALLADTDRSVSVTLTHLPCRGV